MVPELNFGDKNKRGFTFGEGQTARDDVRDFMSELHRSCDDDSGSASTALVKRGDDSICEICQLKL